MFNLLKSQTMNLSKPIFFSKYFLLAISFFPITLSLNAQTCTAANATAFEACAAGSDPIINVTATYTVNNSVDLSGKTIDINNNEDITFTSSVTVNTGTSFSGGGNASVTTTVPDPGITAGTGSSDVTIAELNDAIASGETTLENAMLSAAGLLPVELMYFRALKRNNNVDLQWATALELDNSYF